MHFLHPAFLIGAAAVSVPIIIHLVFKMKARVVPFPSIRFLRQIERQVARRQKLQQWLILALRCLTLLLLALALAGPVYKPSGGAYGASSTAVVIVLDDSYSMALSDPEGPVFAKARAAALAVLRTLKPGDAACVLTSSRPPVMSRDVGSLEEEVRKLEPSAGAGTLRPLAGAAMKLLRETPAAQRELYIVSDFQERAADVADINWFARDFSAVLIPVRSTRRDNLSVEGLEPVSPFATTSVPWRVRATVANRGPDVAGKNLTFRVDDRPVGSQMVQVPPGGTSVVSADLRLEQAGWKTVSAELEDDALRPDNRRLLAVEVRAKLSVLVCRPEAAGPLSRSFYVEKALNPGGSAATGVEIVTCEPSGLAERELDDFAAIFLVEALPLDESVHAAIRSYVAAGGGLVIVPGVSLDPEEFQRAFGPEGDERGPLSPGKFAGVEGDERRPETYQAIREFDPHHPVFVRLRRGSTPIDLGTAAFYRWCRFEPYESARAIAKFRSGDPAILEKPYGAGRVLLVASALHPDVTNLPLKVGFLPLLHGIVGHLTAGPRSEGVLVGEEVRLRLPKSGAPAAAKLYRSPTDVTEARAAVRGGTAEFDFGPAAAPGTLTFEWLAPETLESRVVAVNVDPAEGVLRYVDPAKSFPPEMHTLRSLDDLPSVLTRIRHGRSLAIFFLIAALVAALAEALLANRFAFGGSGGGGGAPGVATLAGIEAAGSQRPAARSGS
ncbi:MAG: BatA domain-containing protein [Planctomycetes bacterium]|nr:BatA domain-containing protein [Planctomycetota bacterium]